MLHHSPHLHSSIGPLTVVIMQVAPLTPPSSTHGGHHAGSTTLRPVRGVGTSRAASAAGEGGGVVPIQGTQEGEGGNDAKPSTRYKHSR